MKQIREIRILKEDITLLKTVTEKKMPIKYLLGLITLRLWRPVEPYSLANIYLTSLDNVEKGSVWIDNNANKWICNNSHYVLQNISVAMNGIYKKPDTLHFLCSVLIKHRF